MDIVRQSVCFVINSITVNSLLFIGSSLMA